MPGLKSCPFCGEMPTLTENFPHEELFTLSCENKECKIHPYRVGKTKEECIIHWNTRAAEPALNISVDWIADFIAEYADSIMVAIDTKDRDYLEKLIAENFANTQTSEPEARALAVEELNFISSDNDNPQWIWIENLLDSSLSAYFKSQCDYTNGRAFCCGYPGMGYHFNYNDYGKTWVAYDREPKGE